MADPVSCQLLTFALSDLPPYEAISYTWGSHQTGGSIFLDGQRYRVTETLATMLEYLRRFNRVVLFWIDALCINMFDLEERSSQVRLMHSIFAQANRVRFWLGTPAETTRIGFEGLRDPAQIFHKDATIEAISSQILSCAAVLTGPWFSRVWVVQEFLLAKYVVFQCGEFQIQHTTAEHSVDFILKEVSKLADSAALKKSRAEQIQRSFQSFSNLDKIWRYWHMSRTNDIMSFKAFMDILVLAQDLEATDERDKIYGLLALAPPSIRATLRPNYSLQIDEVYAQLGFALLSALGPIRVALEARLEGKVPIWMLH